MTHTSPHTAQATRSTSRRADALADRLEQGSEALAAFTLSLTSAEWQTRLPHDGRTAGGVVHHVASVYPIEIQLAQVLAEGKAITDVTWDVIHEMNAKHAAEHVNPPVADALDLLRQNSQAAANAIRALSDDQLALAAPVSLYGDAPLTCQFFLEDHAVRHSYHHLARLRRALRP